MERAQARARKPGPEVGFLLNKAKARTRSETIFEKLDRAFIWARTQARGQKFAQCQLLTARKTLEEA